MSFLGLDLGMKNATIDIEGLVVSLYREKDEDFLSLTDIARKFNPEKPSALIGNWMRIKDTIEFLETWERLHNSNFNLLTFEEIRNEAGTNRFSLSVARWLETGAIGIKSRAGRYGGTYAHKDIAMGFCYWLSPSFQLYLIKEFQRLKEEEAERKRETLEWDVKRMLSKVNYFIHADVVKENLVPPKIYNTKREWVYYASEADMLNVALFGKTAKQWRTENPDKKGNMRDYASAEQLLVLSNLEILNAQFIQDGLSQEERLHKLNETAIYQIELLISQNLKKHLES